MTTPDKLQELARVLKGHYNDNRDVSKRLAYLNFYLNVMTHFHDNKKKIVVCGREYDACDLTVDKFHECATANLTASKDFQKIQISGIPNGNDRVNVFLKSDYSGGDNPWEDAYTETGASHDMYPVHYDQTDIGESDVDMVWSECVPSTPFCGTALQGRLTGKHPTADDPLFMPQSAVENIPSSTLVMCRLDSDAHSAPTLQTLDKLIERLFVTFRVYRVFLRENMPKIRMCFDSEDGKHGNFQVVGKGATSKVIRITKSDFVYKVSDRAEDMQRELDIFNVLGVHKNVVEILAHTNFGGLSLLALPYFHYDLVSFVEKIHSSLPEAKNIAGRSMQWYSRRY